jgi:hypothetical protein
VALPTESRQGCTHRTENPITLGTGIVDEHIQAPGFTHHSLHGTLHGIRVDDIESITCRRVCFACAARCSSRVIGWFLSVMSRIAAYTVCPVLRQCFRGHTAKAAARARNEDNLGVHVCAP